MANDEPETPKPTASFLAGRNARTACVYSVIVVALAIVALALTPTSPNQNRFTPRIVARLGDVNEDFGVGTSCCGMSECPPPRKERNVEIIEEFSPVEPRARFATSSRSWASENHGGLCSTLARIPSPRRVGTGSSGVEFGTRSLFSHESRTIGGIAFVYHN